MALIADVYEVLLKDSEGNVFATTTLQDAKIDVKVKETDVRGGRGNQLIGVLHSDRDIAITLTDVDFKYDWLAAQLGQDIVTGAGVAYAMPKFYEAAGTTTVKVTLDQTPLSVDTLAIYDQNGVKLEASSYALLGKELTFSSGVEAGDTVEVRTYQYATNAKTETITIDNAVFAKGVIAVMETIEIDNQENPINRIQYQFDNTLPTGAFTIEAKSDRSANTSQFNLRVIKPKQSTSVGKVLRFPINQ
ncbi:hypothetical protein [Paenibacillus thalictri]|uniref:Uncharacterized protein n=1 Tax=Paenibacillus thalictri TaxID=2527873 RepID=A0A4Q9DN16_9BACL|nr:hypothetical protein [Paenibacillus thalictri]TBL76244.1 hypothetical protein EYB31_19770 [Paenibacillus thalictri]